MTLAATVAFAAYFVVIAAIAYGSLRRSRGLDGYAIGGRSLKAPVAALSAGASDMSGWLLLGLPGAVFALGLGEAWIVVGLVVGAWCNWRFVAARLRRLSEALDNARTLPQLFARRVGGRVGVLTAVAAAITLGFFALYTAAGFVAGAKLFASVLGLDYAVALWLGVGVIMLYTAVGGFLAVSWTDFFQALLMLAALVVVPACLLLDLGTVASSVDVAGAAGAFSLVGLVSALAWGLGYFGQPHVLVRFMAIESATAVPRARRIGMGWMVISGIGAIAVGALGARHPAVAEAAQADPETVFIVASQLMLHPLVAGVVVAAILAAVMSTVDSQLLVAATTLVDDVVRPARPRLTDARALFLSRATVVGVAALAGALASDPASKVLGLVAYAWAGLGASFGPALILSLFWRGATAKGLIAGMVTGAVTVVGWRGLEGGLFELYELLPAFALASLAIVVVSRFDGGGRAGGAARWRS